MTLHGVSYSPRIPTLIAQASDSSTRALTTNSTFEDVAGTSITFTSENGYNYEYHVEAGWHTASANFIHQQWRCLVDGAATFVTPTDPFIEQEDVSVSGTKFTTAFTFYLRDMPAGSKTVKLQSSDGGSSVDRTFDTTFCWVMRI